MKVIKADAKGVNQAVTFLKEGKSVVYPTDTAYGLGVDATNEKAVKQVFEIKERKANKPVHVIVSGLAMARRYARFTKKTEKIFKKFTPGPLTLVLEVRNKYRNAFKTLTAGSGTIGVRIPDNQVSLAIVRRFGFPITTTSANPSDGPTPYSIEESVSQFERKKHQPDLFLDAGKLEGQEPSTVAAIRDGKVKIFRKGPVSQSEIEAMLKK